MFTKSGCAKAFAVVILVLAVAAGLFYLFVMSRPPVDETPKPSIYENQLRVAIAERTVNLPLYALSAVIQGKSYSIELVPVKEYDECWERLAAGSLDLAIGSLDTIALGLARQRPGVIVFKVADGGGREAIVVKKNLLKPEDLVGRKIAVIPGSTGYMLLTLYLDSAGKTTQECDIIYATDEAQALQALLAGTVDAAVLGDPWLQEALGKKCKAMGPSGSASFIEDYCVVGNNLKSEHPDRVRDVVRAWFQILEIIEKNPGLAKRLIGKTSGISPDSLGRYLESIKFCGLSENKTLQETELVNKIKKFQNFWSLLGEPNAHRPIDFTRCLDLSYVNDLNEEEIQSFVIDDASPTPADTPPPLPTLTTSVTPPVPTISKSPGKTPAPSSSVPAPLPTVTIEVTMPVPTLSSGPVEIP